MELRLPKRDLERMVARVQGIADRRNAMPILSHALLSASKGEGESILTMAATDLEVGIQTRHAAEVQEGGSLAVPARKLFEILRELPDDDVELRGEDATRLVVEGPRVRFILQAAPGEEFPELPKPAPKRRASLNAVLFSTMIERVAYAASTDESRYNLNGVCLEVVESERLRLVATDGHRLAYAERAVGQEAGHLASGAVLPRKAVAELKKLLDEPLGDELEIGFDASHAVVRRGDTTLLMRLVQGEFPNYRQVLPKGEGSRFVVEREELVRALRRASLVVADRLRPVELRFGERTLTVTAINPDLGEARAELPIDYDGDPVRIGFNARYLLDALGSLSAKEVEILVSGELSPARIRAADAEDTVAVVMPMRL